MKYWIIERDSGFSVRIDDVRGQEQMILDKIYRCRQSAWACPSGECRNVASIDERVEGGNIVLTFTARPDTQLDSAGVQECLRYVLGQADKA